MGDAPIVTAEQYRGTFDAGVAVLRDEGFRINRQDFRFGRINSHPQGSPTVFEPWKPDNVHGNEAWRSTFGDLRRVVKISLEPQSTETPDDADVSAYRLRVEVLLEQLQVPERRLNGRTKGSVFADLAEVPTELQTRGITGRYWQPIGRDLALEQQLIRKILAAAQPAPRPS